MTGNQVYLYTLNQLDEAYSDYLSIPSFNRFFRAALYSQVNEIYKNLNTQSAYDKLSFLIKTDQQFTINNDRIAIAPLLITGLSAIGTTLTIKTLSPHNLLPSDAFTLSNVQGLTTIPTLNASHTVVSVLTPFIFTVAITSSSGTYTPDTGIVMYQNMISDYLHTLAINIQCEKLYKDLKGLTVTAETPAKLSFSSKSTLRSGNRVKITGNALLSGTFYIKQLNDKTYELYYDADLLLPVTAVGATATGDRIFIVSYNWGTPYYSDRKIDSFGTPTNIYPKYEDTVREIRFYPTGICKEIKIDYITLPIDVDGADVVKDISKIYPDLFLYQIADKVGELFSISVRDPQFAQQMMGEIAVNNP